MGTMRMIAREKRRRGTFFHTLGAADISSVLRRGGGRVVSVVKQDIHCIAAAGVVIYHFLCFLDYFYAAALRK